MSFRPVLTIARKRDGYALSEGEIREFIAGFVDGSIPDYQMSALAMAIVWRGMTAEETAILLDAMMNSGDLLDWSHLTCATADKHSTGGVGDKVSIPLAPAVAACGVAVPMISGRGLGHTGGTLDKLQSIPGPGRDGRGGGFEVDLPLPVFQAQVAAIGLGLIGQTATIVPADKRLYALRDVTSTVESIPLIVASILSKKLAEGVGFLVLDVKVGPGAFMKTPEQAVLLAEAMVRAGQAAGRKVTAFLTAMDRPLGTHVGNALEISESIEILRGAGPADTRSEVVRLGGEMLRLAGVVPDLQSGETRIARSLDDGSALARFRQVVQVQGGDPRVCDDPQAILPKAPVIVPVLAEKDGVIAQMDALAVGLAAVRLGAGRNRTDDAVDPAVGFVLHKKPGESVVCGEPWAHVHARTAASAAQAQNDLRASVVISQTDGQRLPLWLDVVY